MTTTFKYIDIIEEPYVGKTQKFTVIVRGTEQPPSILGEITWLHTLRQYAFFPTKLTTLLADELIEIASFIKGLMQERKLANQSKPGNWKHEEEEDKGKYSTNQ